MTSYENRNAGNDMVEALPHVESKGLPAQVLELLTNQNDSSLTFIYMKTLYVVGPENRGEGSYSLMTEDGYGLAGHYCSSAMYANLDLIDGRPERLENWKEYLKDGYKLEYVSRESEKYKELLAKNHAFTDKSLDKYKKDVLMEASE